MPHNRSGIPRRHTDEDEDSNTKQRIVLQQIAEDHQSKDQTKDSGKKIKGHFGYVYSAPARRGRSAMKRLHKLPIVIDIIASSKPMPNVSQYVRAIPGGTLLTDSYLAASARPLIMPATCPEEA